MFRRHLIVILFAAMLLGVAACSHHPKVIPSSKMSRIYREMLLADEWLKANPEKHPVADTTWFYEPIFEKYGYSHADYLNTVNYFLNDPERFAELMSKVAKGLEDDAARTRKSIEHKERLRFKADSLAAVIRESMESRDFFLYENLFLILSRTDTLHLVKNSEGVYCPQLVIGDTMFKGPELIIKDSSAVKDSATLETERHLMLEAPVEEHPHERPSTEKVGKPASRFPAIVPDDKGLASPDVFFKAPQRRHGRNAAKDKARKKDNVEESAS